MAWCVWLLIPGLVPGSEPNISRQRSPNVILIMADDMGWGDPGYQGHPRLKTPGLDAMAKNGLRLNRFYAAAPVCSPTRGSCLTGRHPFRYGVFFANVGHLKTQEISLAEYLQGQGYRTGHFGKWHLGTLTKKVRDSNRGGPRQTEHFSPPDRHGFGHYFSTEAKTPTFDPLLKPAGERSATHWLPVGPGDPSDSYGTRYWENGKAVEQELRGDDSAIIMDEALRFMEKHQTRPFFSVIWFHAPHLPVVASESDRREFADLDPYHQSYLGCLRALDRQIVRLRQSLREWGIADQTLVCFCSDNGPEGNAQAPGSAGKLRGRKRSLYEGGIRVPGIIEWPAGIRPGSVSNTIAVTSDYFPTVVELTGGQLPDRPYDGVSLVPLFDDPEHQRTLPIFFESRRIAAVIEQRYKLLVRLDQQGRMTEESELYDVDSDPAESINLAQQAPEEVERLRQSLKQWRASCRDSLSGKDYP